jgi:hypothetical protein
MKRLLAAVAAVAAVLTPSALADVKITDQPYVRHDGGTDATIADCSANNRQQNEPSAAVDPTNAMRMVAGANDYCSVPTGGGTWAGFYYSANGGASWINSLLPGYPTDTSTEGQASPLFGLANNAGDPVQAWDRMGHLYYAGIAFNRARPANGSIWVARYDWQAGPAPDYRYTTIADRGTPSPLFRGIFDDKVQMEVDRGVVSPHAGNVYVCYAQFTGSGANNSVYFLRSTDAARTFSKQKISEGVHGSQFCDIAVTKDGTVFVVWRQFSFQRQQRDGVAWVKSTDGGRTFTKARIATEFVPWDLTDHYGSPAAAGQARYDACLAADLTPGACASPEPRNDARDCGDGPFVCQSGYVFFRADSQTRVTADPEATGDADAAYVVYEASVPGSETPTGTSYGTVGSGTGTQASLYFIRTTNGGATWSAPARVDPQAKGHQFFPDIDASGGELHAVYHDSRFDCATGPPSTPSGGDFRTVPFSNRWVASNPPGGVSCGPGLDTFYATSTNGGASWTTLRASAVSQMPQYEQFGFRDIPFHGDYNYVSAAGGTVLLNWTDQRDAVAGTDPRYTNGDGTDGFDVLNCISGASDPCANNGGLDQNIYGLVLG